MTIALTVVVGIVILAMLAIASKPSKRDTPPIAVWTQNGVKRASKNWRG